MTVYQNKKTGSWKAEVWVQNKRHITKTFSKKALADKFEREQTAQIELQILTGSHAKDYTYNEIFEFWHTNASSRKRVTSLVKDVQMHKHYIEPILGKLRVSEVTPFHFEKIVSQMKKKELSKASINKVIQHFKAVFNHSFNNETIARNPPRSYKQLRLDQKEMDYLTQEEMDQLLTHTNQKYVGVNRWKHVMYLALFLTGGRLGEVLGLEWHRIQFEKNSILIGQMWCAISNKLIFTTKGKKDRVVPLNSLLKKELGAMKNLSKGSFLFSDVSNRPIDPKNFRSRNWDKDLKAAGVRQIRIHDARHTYASLFMMSGGNLYDLKKVLGHTDVKTTERYAHLSNDHLAGVRDIIKPNIGTNAEIISVNSFSKNLDVSYPPQKSERGQDDISLMNVSG